MMQEEDKSRKCVCWFSSLSARWQLSLNKTLKKKTNVMGPFMVIVQPKMEKNTIIIYRFMKESYINSKNAVLCAVPKDIFAGKQKRTIYT